MFKVGDYVFAHIRGHTIWPATVNKLEIKGKTTYYSVDFFGPKKESGQCTASKLYLFEENKKKIATGKILEDNNFLQALTEIENEIKTKKSKNILKSPLSFSSTPKNSKTKKDMSKSLNSSSSTVVDKCINTSMDLDQGVQLEALTDKCIDLEKKLIQYEETLSSLKISEQDLENKYKLLKLENENLKTVSEILQEENKSLEEKLLVLKSSSANCLNCFPPIMPSQSSANMSASNSWTQATRSKKNISKLRSPQSNIVIPCRNSFAPLAKPDEETEEEDEDETVNMVESDVLICADSHGRDVAYHLNTIKKCNNAFAFINPGGHCKDILNSKNIDSVALKKKDAMVLICGTNDVSKNQACEALENITLTLNKYPRTNIVLVDLPKRYDLPNWSVVNKEVSKTNASLQVLSQQHPNVTLVQASKAKRHFHTRHGLHLNQMGKKWLAGNISEAITTMTEPRKPHSPGIVQQPPPPGVGEMTQIGLVASPVVGGKPTKKRPEEVLVASTPAAGVQTQEGSSALSTTQQKEQPTTPDDISITSSTEFTSVHQPPASLSESESSQASVVQCDIQQPSESFSQQQSSQETISNEQGISVNLSNLLSSPVSHHMTSPPSSTPDRLSTLNSHQTLPTPKT